MIEETIKPQSIKKSASILNNWTITAAKILSMMMFIFLRYLLKYRYKVILANLTSSFPLKNKHELRQLTASYYHHMSDLFVEPFLFYIISAGLRRKLATYTNKELLQRLYKDNKQVVLLASHYGNWEYLTNLPQVAGYDVYSAYSPVKNRYINRMMLKLRSFLGVTLIPRKQFYRKALSLLQQGGAPKLIMLIADQRPAPGSGKYHLPFLHQDTKVQIGGERMAVSADAAVVYIDSEKTSRFHYNFTFRMISEKAAHAVPMEITSRYFDVLEKAINRSPVYWLWSHNRWAQTF
jgi:KDO2-lipid IV(A) lauroyltransferase